MIPPLEHAWPRFAADLRGAVAETAWSQWLAALEPVGVEGSQLVLSAPAATCGWIAERFGRTLDRVADASLGAGSRVRLVPPDAKVLDPRPASATSRCEPQQDDDPGAPRAPNPDLTFDHFVIGDGNRLAHAAALSVAEHPGQAYNPLFIHGPPGLGKTHLLHAIAHYVLAFVPGATVRLTNVETFTGEFVGALRGGGPAAIEAFKARHRSVDVLLVDDVQFLQSKDRTEEELFHTLNALAEVGAQVVLTSDRRPHELGGLADRLRERFAAGLVCEVGAPDRRTRLAVLRKRAAHDGISVVPDALDVIADRIADNVRVLEGALIRVVAFASLTGRAVDVQLADEVLAGLYPPRRAVRRSVEDVQDAVAERFALTRADLVSASRAQRVTWPRFVAMYLARELTDGTLPAIGAAFGGRDHTTVLNACKRTAERMARDPEALRAVTELTDRLRAPQA